MIISISGPPGSGKSTVAKLLAKKLGWKRYYMGGLRREAARKRGLTLEEYNKLGEVNPSTDLEVDKFQEELGKREDNFVIEGRTSFYFIPHSLKVYLDVDPMEGARRVFEDLKNNASERNERVFSSVEETRKNLDDRMRSDVKRYKKYFGFDCYDVNNYDLVIDTTNKSPDEIVDEIIFFAENNGLKKHLST